MWHGALPYVDIWDRKPIGLFLLYAAIRLLGGAGILQYQLVALACTVATSLVIHRIARTVASHNAALCAGVAYQCCLSAFMCFGGQAPVFYNLLMALAGLGMLRIWSAPDDRRLLVHGLGVMALVGIALQIKYTVVFEGIAFGLALIWRARLARWSRAVIALAALGWCATALLPTLAALASYRSIGHGDAFIAANFFSIFGKHEDVLTPLWRLSKESISLFPVWLAIFWAPRHLPPLSGEQQHARTFLRYWAGAAVFGFLIFGTWYDHYVAPLLVPLMALSTPALAARSLRWLSVAMLGLSAAGAAAVTYVNMSNQGSRQQISALTTAINARLANGCLYVNEGDPALYLLTRSCLPTPYIFPNHFNNAAEQFALGVDVNTELRALLARRPTVVAIMTEPSSTPVNWASRRLLLGQLNVNYTRFATLPAGSREYQLYALRTTQLSMAR